MQQLSTEDLQKQQKQGLKIRAASEAAFGFSTIKKSKSLRTTADHLCGLIQRVIGWEQNAPSALKRLHELFATYPEFKELYTEDELKMLRYQTLHLNHYGVFDYT